MNSSMSSIAHSGLRSVLVGEDAETWVDALDRLADAGQWLVSALEVLGGEAHATGMQGRHDGKIDREETYCLISFRGAFARIPKSLRWPGGQ